MKFKLLVLALLLWGYWFYMHDFQTKAMTAVDGLKNSYAQVIDISSNGSPLASQK